MPQSVLALRPNVGGKGLAGVSRVRELQPLQPMFISKLIDGRNVGLKRLPLLTHRRLNEEIKTKITNTTLKDDVFGAVHVGVVGANKCVTNCLGLSELCAHEEYTVLGSVRYIQVADNLHCGLVSHCSHVPPQCILVRDRDKDYCL